MAFQLRHADRRACAWSYLLPPGLLLRPRAASAALALGAFEITGATPPIPILSHWSGMGSRHQYFCRHCFNIFVTVIMTCRKKNAGHKCTTQWIDVQLCHRHQGRTVPGLAAPALSLSIYCPDSPQKLTTLLTSTIIIFLLFP